MPAHRIGIDRKTDERMTEMRNEGKPDRESGARPTCGRDGPPIAPISAQDHAGQEALRALNNANERETSFLTDEDWRALVAGSFAATCTSGAGALLIALDQDAEYRSVNFKWFKARRRRFVYVDRVVVSERCRGLGVATRLYRDLFERTRKAGHDRIVCEVNLNPPNPVSDAFHAKLGFEEAGRAELEPGGRTVRYLEKRL